LRAARFNRFRGKQRPAIVVFFLDDIGIKLHFMATDIADPNRGYAKLKETAWEL
jgi:hypothetical protein